MKKKTLIVIAICIVGILMLIAILAFEKLTNSGLRPTLGYSDEEITALPSFYVVAAAGENRQLPSDVTGYCLGDPTIHLVIPSAVSRRSMVVYLMDSAGNNLARRVYDFTKDVTIGNYTIVIDAPNLPVLYFESGSHDEFISMNTDPEMAAVCYGNMQICVDKDAAAKNGWFTEYPSVERNGDAPHTASLRGRGNSSWGCTSKKSYTLSLEEPMNILGMGKNKNWNLIGNAFDVSLLKNSVFNKLSSEVGIAYQPHMQFVNLYIDGEYYGIYLITTKVSVDNDRVALSKKDFFYKIDAPACEQPLAYETKTWFEDGYSSPRADLLYPKDASEEQLSEASAHLQSFIDAMESGSWDKLTDVVDVDSLVRYYWVQEASMNFDAWARSVYVYYDASDKKMHLGPVWDMDLTLGSPFDKAGMLFTDPEGWRVRNAGWYTALFQNEEFVNAVNNAYLEGGIKDALADSLDEFARQKEALGNDAYLNYIMFGHDNRGVTLDYGDTYDDYCANMIEFYRHRLAWIDSCLILTVQDDKMVSND